MIIFPAYANCVLIATNITYCTEYIDKLKLYVTSYKSVWRLLTLTTYDIINVDDDEMIIDNYDKHYKILINRRSLLINQTILETNKSHYW